MTELYTAHRDFMNTSIYLADVHQTMERIDLELKRLNFVLRNQALFPATAPKELPSHSDKIRSL